MATLAVGGLGMRGKPMRQITVMGGRTLPKEEAAAVRLEVSRAIGAAQSRQRLVMLAQRNAVSTERPSVARAMLAVEDRLVRAFWTIARLPGDRIGGNGRCGLDYVAERGDLNGYADAAGGKWESIAPRPPLPSAKDIDDAKAAIDWLLLLESESLRKVLVVGATSKRGEVARRVPWTRLRRILGSYTERHLRRKYQEALRTIVTELTLARLGR